MNPNQSSNFPPYSNQFKPNQYNNYQLPNQQQFNQNTLNIPKTNFNQGGSHSPTQNHQVNRNKLDRAMYSSTIESIQPSKSFGIGKLESMGRFVGGNDEFRNQTKKPSYEFQSASNQLSRYESCQISQKTVEPQFQANRQNEFDRFPSFNLNENHVNQQGFSNQNIHAPLSQRDHQQNLNETLTPQQKRRREILAIKQELQMINKKMESSNLNKKYTTEPISNSFNSPVSNNSPQNYANNSYLNPTVSTSGSSTGSSYGSSNFDNGLSFARNNNQLGVGQRNKGLVTQSMIVSNEPSPGFKSQSIFDKYDSMKKPTYETYNTVEKQEQRPSLLDQFVKKGPGSDLSKKPEILNFANNSNSPNSQNNNNKNSFDFNSVPKNSVPSSSFNSNYVIQHNNNPSTTLNVNSATTYGPQIVEPPKQGGGMFKKKKFTEQINTEFTAQQQKGPDTQINFAFKKSPRHHYEENIVTKAMKEMKIEESVEFKREDFVVGKKLGKGQFGQVMLVQHKKTGFLCGMKVMQKKQIRDQKYEGQIARELSVQFYLAHRNIAPLYGYFQDEKNVYLLVEYCTGGQLLEMLRKNRRMEQPQVSRIIKQIIEGIDYIHKELIIHRDIKPENILFNFGVAKICDFGWAVYKGHGMRKTASVGSPLYYSPQIVMGVEYDEKIDIWDIGMMTYECLLGKIPFRIYSELDLNRIVQDEIKFPQYIDTSEEAKDFILKIMKKKPEERMEIREMLRHPFITKYQEQKLPVEIMKDFKEVLS